GRAVRARTSRARDRCAHDPGPGPWRGRRVAVAGGASGAPRAGRLPAGAADRSAPHVLRGPYRRGGGHRQSGRRDPAPLHRQSRSHLALGGSMSHLLQPVLGIALPPYGVGGFLILLLYVIQAEIRFGPKARTSAAGAADRGSTIALSLAAIVPVIGFVLAMEARIPALLAGFPAWLRGTMPGMPAIAWVGVGVGVLGLALRFWAVLTLRERYTRTLLV